MYRLNPTLPAYLTKNTFRLGSLPLTGKHIDQLPPNITSFFEFIGNGTFSYSTLLNFFICKGIDHCEAEMLLKKLIKNNILIENSLLIPYKEKGEVNRAALFISMFTNLDKGIDLFKRMHDAKILILGVGAIGCIVASSLIRNGVQNLTLIDADKVEFSNIQRQPLYDIQDIGKYKVEVARQKLLRINPKANINILTQTIRAESDFSSLTDSTLVVSTIDYPMRKIRSIVNRIFVQLQIPFIFAGFSEYVINVGPLVIPQKTACWECILSKMDQLPTYLSNVLETPSFISICEIAAAITVMEIVKYITSFEHPVTLGSILSIDAINYNKSLKKWDRDPTCKVCGYNG